MISQSVFQYWIDCSGIREQAKHLEAAQVEAYLQVLTGIEDADKLRRQLANSEELEATIRDTPAFQNADKILDRLANDTRNALNRATAWYLLNSCLDQFDSAEADNLANFIEWALLVAEYAGPDPATNLLKAHANFLNGVRLHNDVDYEKASEAYWAGEELYASNADWSLLVSICQFCQGRLQTDFDRTEQAEVLYAKARGSAENAGTQPANWLEIMQGDQARRRQQRAFLEQLLAAGSIDQQRSLLEANPELVDKDLALLAKSRNYRLLFENKHDEALQASGLTTELAARFSAEGDFRRTLVAYYNDQRDYARAEALVQMMLQDNSADEELWLSLARILLQQGRLKEGIDLLQQIVKVNPQNAEAFAILGGYFTGSQQWFAANYYLERALSIDPDNAAAKYYARIVPPPAVHLDPQTKQMVISEDILGKKSPDVLADLMMAAMLTSLPDQRDELLASIARDKGEEAARRVHAIAFGEVGVASQAGAELSHFDRAEQLFAVRQLEEAIKEYELAIEEDAANADAYMGLGDAYYMQGKFETAIAYFEESIAIKPKATTYRFIGDSYRHLNAPDKAIDAYESALKLDPNYTTAREALESIRQQRGGK